jgi:hypothetical protein
MILYTEVLSPGKRAHTFDVLVLGGVRRSHDGNIFAWEVLGHSCQFDFDGAVAHSGSLERENGQLRRVGNMAHQSHFRNVAK